VRTIRGYIAGSLDGYIADKNGGVDFLKPYETVDYGFTEFFAEIGTCVLGRATYEQTFTFGPDWPFATKQVIVVARKPLSRQPANVEVWRDGVEAALVKRLRAKAPLDVWVVGGSQLQSALFDLDAIDRLQLGLVPVLLGDGIPLFAKSARQPRLSSARQRRSRKAW
jgi:dihydrofolate reductase